MHKGKKAQGAGPEEGKESAGRRARRMKKDMIRRNKKTLAGGWPMARRFVAAGVILCLLAGILPLAAMGGEKDTKSALSDKEASAETVMSEKEASAGTALSDKEAETESVMSDSDRADIEELVRDYYTETIQKEINKIPLKEIEKYAGQIKKLITNPDFQAIFSYEDVRELAVTLIHNALDFSSSDPNLAEKILETLGVDQKVILLFFTLLYANLEKNNIADSIRTFLDTEEGKELMSELNEMFNDSQVQIMIKDFLTTYEELEDPQRETEPGMVAETEGIGNTEAAKSA